MDATTPSVDLSRRTANHVPLTPLDFLRRSAMVYPDKTAVVYGPLRRSWAEVERRARVLASAVSRAGVRPGEVVSVLAFNTPAMLEAHFGIPGAGAVLNAINTRLDPPAVAFILEHAESRLFLVDRGLSAVARAALEHMAAPPRVVWIDDPAAQDADPVGDLEYEDFLKTGDPETLWRTPEDEWESIALNYTSGTTGNPKGVLYHHRGAHLNALGNVITFGLRPDSVYLWTLPMFHCNGWTYPWAVTAVGATHVCLRAVDPAAIFRLIAEEKVTHLCGAPVVLTMLIHAPDAVKRGFDHDPVQVATGGAAPPSAVIAGMERMGFRLTHLYGMTECYGPSTGCAWQGSWAELPLEERAVKMARQGVPNVTMSEQTVLDPDTGREVPADGETLGELALRGNTVMKGYLKNPTATDEALRDGWLHTGDLAVLHPDRYVEIKDRAKDIIISGGENIASLEVEEVLYKHPHVMEAAVVARPDAKWGETPCAFVTLKPGSEGQVSEAEVIGWCRDHLAHFKTPRTVVFGALPKTSTGKIQKFVLREQARGL
ncbi:acyl-CoA synthetase [Azospirillum argentinense]|uniref:3-methylmercaptopropionyl-CoA ligase n=1 Tax=Azospirillum argentinense TaxID=2970906 RepID=A0A060DFF0_9PROT|nr:acyl-CoA synthetase [Azospirillum argentinense]AIB11405.1 acyl-CoA synthetase [Azospirillum argentinense]EZQ08327.1 acyl-CoA synthetase [Azospirillum argentinense]